LALDIDKLPEVTSPDIYVKNTDKYDPNGLFSEQIFGPVKDYKCQCGELNSKILHKGKICPNCKVLCESSDLRYDSYGKIVLPIKIAKFLYLDKIKKICHKFSNILDPNQYDLFRYNNVFVNYDFNKDRVFLSDEINESSLKLKITGIFTLFLGLNLIYKATGSQKIKNVVDEYFTNSIVVSPPNTRTNFKLNNKDIIGKINNYYQKLILINNYFKKSISETFTEFNLDKIIDKYYDLVSKSEDPYSDDNLLFLDLYSSRLQYSANEIYKSLIDTLSHKEGIVRGLFISKTIDFSSRCVLGCNPSLLAYQIKIPKHSFIKLWMIEFLYYLIKYKNISKDNFLLTIKMTNYLYTQYNEYTDDFIEWFFNSPEIDRKKKLVLLNRQPTLFKYGITGVEVVGLSEGNIIEVSPFILEQLNGDCDGDCVAIYRLHNINSLEEIYDKNFNLNMTKYEHNNINLHKCRLEALYAFNILMSTNYNSNKTPIKCDKLSELNGDYEIDQPIMINDKIYSYGVCLVNKWCKFDNVIIDKLINNNELSEVIYKNSISKQNYHETLSNLYKNLVWYISTTNKLTIPFELNIFEKDDIKTMIQKLPNNPIIGQHIYESLVKKLKDKYEGNKDSNIFKLLSTKLSISQLARSIVGIGYIADNNNIVRNIPITSAVMTGLKEDEFFESSYGSRKGIVDKTNATPESGYLERTMVMNLCNIEIVEDDCRSNRLFDITILNDKHNKSLIGRYYLNEENNRLELFNGGEIGSTYKFRSPITCQTKDFKICKKCFGEYKVTSKYVGILSSQYVSERLTQLTMRTFHTSGQCKLDTDQRVVDFFKEHLVDIKFDNNMTYTVYFDTAVTDLAKIFYELGCTHVGDNYIEFDVFNGVIENKDVTKNISAIQNILTSKKTNISSTIISDDYNLFIRNILDVGMLYSSFVEIILCNLYMTNNNKIYRYDLDDVVKRRIGIKNLCKLSNGVSQLLYEPNRFSIRQISDSSGELIKPNSIYEQLWMNNVIFE